MAKKYRVKELRFLNKIERTTRVIYTPQIWFDGGWCYFPDSSTESELIEHNDKASALKNAKELYEEFCVKVEQ